MAETEITFDFLGRQLDRVLNELGSVREDMTVMMTIVQRQEHVLNSISTQLTDMHAYNRRVEARVARLEEQS